MNKSFVQSKLLYFLIFLFAGTLFSACSSDKENEEIIPYTYINFSINLDYYNHLNPIGNSIHFKQMPGGASLGYKGHGIIVTHTVDGFVAYDATCTLNVEAAESLKLSEPIAECPICNSKFNLLDAYPLNESEAKYPLKKYRTRYSVSNNTLYISN
ncbi:MAG: Rieske (2Fe-2S) protein [Marinifilaceae bacterium]